MQRLTRNQSLLMLSGALGLFSLYLQRQQTKQNERRRAEFDAHNKDIKRGNKELEALNQHLDDKIETGKFWLQVTQED